MLTDVIIEMVEEVLWGGGAWQSGRRSPQLDRAAIVGLSLTEQGIPANLVRCAKSAMRERPVYVEEFIRVLAEHPIPHMRAVRQGLLRENGRAA